MKYSAAFSYTSDELQHAMEPIASLIRKSEKAQQKLAPGTWQHRTLGENLKALQIASALMSKSGDNTDAFTKVDLDETLGALGSMIRKAQKAQLSFRPGTSQHSLQRNRLAALGLAKTIVAAELNDA